MTYDDLVKHFGRPSRIAEALGVAPATVTGWRKDGIPSARQFVIQTMTRGRLKAEPMPIKTRYHERTEERAP